MAASFNFQPAGPVIIAIIQSRGIWILFKCVIRRQTIYLFLGGKCSGNTNSGPLQKDRCDKKDHKTRKMPPVFFK